MLILTIEDVKAFLQSLYNKYDLAFHPDDSFHDYVDSKGQMTFSEKEADLLNELMERCFVVCEEHGIDLYEICVELQQVEFVKRKVDE